MSDIPEVDLIAYAITETFGERCPDYEETCPCCKAWEQYDARESYANLINVIADIREKSGVGGKPMLGELADAIEARMAAAEQRGVERERERWKPASVYFERYCQDEAEDEDECVCGLQQHNDAKAFAAAIRKGQP